MYVVALFFSPFLFVPLFFMPLMAKSAAKAAEKTLL